eukprot:1160631-Pelagomonas_calceolata.AAC.4
MLCRSETVFKKAVAKASQQTSMLWLRPACPCGKGDVAMPEIRKPVNVIEGRSAHVLSRWLWPEARQPVNVVMGEEVSL